MLLVDNALSVGDVATWLGVITGVAGITLAVVSLAFTYYVSKEAREISSATVSALARIESTSRESSDQIRNLIRVAWEQMLGVGGKDGGTNDASEVEDNATAEVLTDQIRTDLDEAAAPGDMATTAALERIERVLEDHEQRLRAALTVARATQRASGRAQFGYVGSRGRALAIALGDKFLTSEVANKLRDDEYLGGSYRELMAAGYIQRFTRKLGDRLILGRQVRPDAVLLLLTMRPVPETLMQRVRDALARIGVESEVDGAVREAEE